MRDGCERVHNDSHFFTGLQHCFSPELHLNTTSDITSQKGPPFFFEKRMKIYRTEKIYITKHRDYNEKSNVNWKE